MMNKLLELGITAIIMTSIGIAMFRKKYSIMWLGGLLLIAILNFA